MLSGACLVSSSPSVPALSLHHEQLHKSCLAAPSLVCRTQVWPDGALKFSWEVCLSAVMHPACRICSGE